jgi:hypothetical protein
VEESHNVVSGTSFNNGIRTTHIRMQNKENVEETVNAFRTSHSRIETPCSKCGSPLAKTILQFSNGMIVDGFVCTKCDNTGSVCNSSEKGSHCAYCRPR